MLGILEANVVKSELLLLLSSFHDNLEIVVFMYLLVESMLGMEGSRT